jgi:hypothetical protein
MPPPNTPLQWWEYVTYVAIAVVIGAILYGLTLADWR